MKVKLTSITPKGELLIERCARTCYGKDSKLVKEVNGDFVKNIVQQKHFSVLEHASASFEISGVSRALTHQLVRHRHHSFSQQSQRYCKLKNSLTIFVIPPTIAKNPKAAKEYRSTLRMILKSYHKLIDDYSIPKEDARLLLSNATKSVINVTGNLSAWRHFLEVRLPKNSQWEIRELAHQILVKLYEKCPNVFSDLYEKYANLSQNEEEDNE